MSVYKSERAYRTEWDESLGAVVHKWHQYVDGETFREGCEAMLDAIKEHDSSAILIDHRDMKVVDRGDQEYIVDEWVPGAVEAGCKNHIVVHQESTIAEMNIDSVMHLDEYDYVSEMTSDIDEARQWVADR